jgi:hypothetical protein
MTDREEGKERKKAQRDRWAISISIISLLITLSAFVLGSLLQKDDVRVVIGEPPGVNVNEKGEIYVSGSQTLTFINSGNRAAAVTDIGALAWNASGSEKPKTDCVESQQEPSFPTPLESRQFVLKNGEFSVINLDVREQLFWKKRKDGNIYFMGTKDFRVKVGDSFYTCLTLNIVTPDNILSRWSHPAFKFKVEEGFGGLSAVPEPLFNAEKPIAVLFETNFHSAWQLVPVGSAERVSLEKQRANSIK